MTDKLHCPFCGAELLSDPEYLHSEHLHCENPECIFPSSVELHISVWRKMIDGKKAQEDLECMKHNYSVLSEQREIAYQNYLKITGDLQKQLQKAQHDLKIAIDTLTWIANNHLADNEIRIEQLRRCARDALAQINNKGK